MMAMEGSTLRRLVPALLECLLLLHVIGYVPSVEGHCIWYGVCANETELGKPNCFYNGTAKPIQEESRNILNEFCPELASGPVCCNNDQVNLFNRVLGGSIFVPCPSCKVNFMQHLCAMACSPNQSDFIKPVTIQQFNSTHQQVTKIDYHLSYTYMEAVFNSCKNVPFSYPDKNGTVLDLMCGERNAANCTAERWFQYMWDPNNPYLPYKINFVAEDDPTDGYTLFNPPTKTGSYEEGCQRIIPTEKEDIIEKTTEHDSLTVETKTSTTENKRNCCTSNCDSEFMYNLEQRKLKLEEEKLALLREQTVALKLIAEKMTQERE